MKGEAIRSGPATVTGVANVPSALPRATCICATTLPSVLLVCEVWDMMTRSGFESLFRSAMTATFAVRVVVVWLE